MLRINHGLWALTCCLLLSAPAALAADVNKVNQEMQKAGTAMSLLIPYIYNDTAFREAKSRDFILDQLDTLIATMTATPRLLSDHAVIQTISQTSLLGQLKQARVLFNTGSFATSQYLLSGVPVLCSSCHIQDGVAAKGTPAVNREHFANAFSYAEFNFYVRNYVVAEAAYLEHLNRHEVKTSRIQGGKTLERLLDIALIAGKNRDKAPERLREYQSIEGLDAELVQRIGQWLDGIARLDRTSLKNADLEALIQKEFNSGSGMQHEFIFDEAKRPLALVWRAELQQRSTVVVGETETAKHLYLIAILQRMLGEQTELSLANLYLKECIRFNVKVYSLKCMNEYENHLYFYYGGSSGEHLPPEAMEELNRLRNAMKKNI